MGGHKKDKTKARVDVDDVEKATANEAPAGWEETWIRASFVLTLIHMVALIAYLLVSLGAVNKAIFFSDSLIIPIVSCMFHYIKGSTGDHHGYTLILSMTFSFLVIGVLIFHLVYNGGRYKDEVYTGTTGVAVGFSMIRKRLDPEATYSQWRYPYRLYMLVVSLTIEMFTVCISVVIFKRYRPPPGEDRTPCCHGHFVIPNCRQVKTFCCWKRKIAQRPKPGGWTILGLKIIVAHALFFTLTSRIGLSLASIFYDLPYWTEQDTPSGFFYFALFILFEILLSRSKDRSLCATALALVFMITATGISIYALVCDQLLLSNRSVGFLTDTEGYLGALSNNQDMGGWVYTIPIGTANSASNAFGKMTQAAHWVSMAEIVMMVLIDFLLVALLAYWSISRPK